MLLPPILIVDDIEENLLYLETIIKKFKTTIIKASNGHDALEKTKDIELALAIIDVRMPEMNGYELAIKLNERKTENKIPVVFLTANLSSELEILEGYNAGAVDYIFKPINVNIIQSKVKVFLELFVQKQIIVKDARKLKQSTENLKALNISLKESEKKERKLSAELKHTLNNLEKLVEIRTHELNRSQELYYTTVNSLTEWIFVVDEKLNFVFLNEALNNLLINNLTSETVIGKNIFRVLNFINDKHLVFYEKVFDTKKSQIIKGQYDVYGKLYYLLMKFSPVFLNKKVIRIVTTIYDYTKQKQVEKDILKNLKKEKALNDMKSHFISTVSHEFRTPLAGISSSVQLLQKYDDKWDSLKKDKMYNQIFDALNHTQKILDNISVLDKKESTHISLNFQYINLKELLLRIIEENKQVFGAEFNIVTNFRLNDSLYFLDKNAIITILGNVLSNAIKYSGESKLVYFFAFDSKKNISFSIIDFGIGISKNETKLVFDEFYRASNAGSVQGTGFGLSIVKKYIEAYKGKIVINSELLKGTNVKIKIPKNNTNLI